MDGDDSRENEVVGNKLAERTARLCEALRKAGCFYSIENPATSYVWEFAPIRRLLDSDGSVSFDQCEYQLAPPGQIESERGGRSQQGSDSEVDPARNKPRWIKRSRMCLFRKSSAFSL